MRRAVLGRCLLLASIVIAVATSTFPGAAARLPAIPSPAELLLLVRTTMIAIDQANKTGDYAVLRALGGPGLQAYSDAQLARTFAPFRRNGADLAQAAIATPQLSEPPVVSAAGRLTLTGFFPTRPLRISFRFVFEASRGSWRPFGLSVSLARAPAPTGSAKRH
jgi:hypothetical protein